MLHKTLTAVNDFKIEGEDMRELNVKLHAAVSPLKCVCVCLQQVDTDKPVFTMTERLFPH